HISHIKVSGRRAWGRAPDMIALIRRERGKGLRITADQYPYMASSTSLAAMVIPPRYREGSAKELLARLDDSELGPRIRKDIETLSDGREGARRFRIASFPPRKEWQGKDLDAIATEQKKPLLDLVLEIQKQGGASIVSFGMKEEEVRLFMKED